MTNLSTMEYASTCKNYSNSLVVICRHSSLLSVPGGPGLLAVILPKIWPSTRALKFEKLKAPLFPGPRGAVDTNDWWIVVYVVRF